VQEGGGNSCCEAEQRKSDDDEQRVAFHSRRAMVMDAGPSGQRRIMPRAMTSGRILTRWPLPR
jgi:hypothetical protein